MNRVKQQARSEFHGTAAAAHAAQRQQSVPIGERGTAVDRIAALLAPVQPPAVGALRQREIARNHAHQVIVDRLHDHVVHVRHHVVGARSRTQFPQPGHCLETLLTHY